MRAEVEETIDRLNNINNHNKREYLGPEYGRDVSRRVFGKDKRRYGMELEFDTHEFWDTFRWVFYPMRKWFAISMESGYRPEVKSRPMSYRFIKNNLDLFYPFEYIWDNYKEFLLPSQDGSGLHITIDKDFFLDSDHFARFNEFIMSRKYKTFVRAFSQRSDESWASWCACLYSDKRTKEVVHDTAKRAFNKKDFCSGWDRALYKKDIDAVEVRLFRGTVNPKEFLSKIEFIHALVNYTKATTRSEEHWPNFVERFSKEDSLPYLKQFILKEVTCV